VLERALEAPADEPRVECVVAVLHQHRAVREAKEGAARILEDRRTDQHRAVDIVALLRVGVDRRAAVDQRVEKGERAIQAKALRAELEDEEGRVARRLHIERHELGVVERRQGADLGSVDRDLFPGHGLGGAPRLEEEGTRAHRASVIDRRAQVISSRVTARSRRMATP
jgi:hypothetical protein